MSQLSLNKEVVDYLIKARRHLHQYPELSFEEHRTAEYVERELDSMGIPHRRMAKTGVVADIMGKEKGPTVALRGDMDALPVEEDSDLPFRSKNKGKMHACGHDLHTATILAIAKQLVDRNLPVSGNVRLIFQPSEEHAPGGALRMVEEGVMQGVDYVLGQHTHPRMEAGKVGLYPSTMMAYTDDFYVEITGSGGHAGYPQEAPNLVLLAAQFIDTVQSIISVGKDPFDPAVVSFCTIHGGEKENIIARNIKIGGTIRTLNLKTRETIMKRMETMLAGICNTFGAEYTIALEEGYPALTNDREVTGILGEVAKELLGEENVSYPLPDLGGEDFAYFTQKVPGTYYYLGVGRKEGNDDNIWHSPTFFINEEALEIGATLLYRTAMKLLEKEGAEGGGRIA